MKKIFFAFIICIATSFATRAQSQVLNKQQTLDYINEMTPKVISDPDDAIKFAVVYADLEMGPFGVVKGIRRVNLTKVKDVILVSYPSPLPSQESVINYGLSFSFKEEEKKASIIQFIVKEDDAKRLKKAFEHLVELVKKEGDPFGN